MRLTVGSLCSGIGGFEVGFTQAGMRVLWQAETDEYCRRVLEKHWPGVPRYGDIKGVDWSAVQSPDVLCAGFPCQPVSKAGLGLAQADPRWLWPEVARCLCELGERPRWVVLENVSALTSRGLGDVLRDLAALGYDSEYSCISAAQLGARHLRDRIWIVAYPNNCTGQTQRGKRPHIESEGAGRGDDRGRGPSDAQREESLRVTGGDRKMAHTKHTGLERHTWHGPGGEEPGRDDSQEGRSACAPSVFTWKSYRLLEELRRTRGAQLWGVDPTTIPGSGVRRVSHGVRNRAHRLRGLGNAVVPLIPEWLGMIILELEQQKGRAK